MSRDPSDAGAGTPDVGTSGSAGAATFGPAGTRSPATPGVGSPDPAPARGRSLRTRPQTLPVVLLVVAIVLIVVGVAFQVRHHTTRAARPQNTALTDTAATGQVIGQVSSALNTVLSYDYKNPAPTQAAAAQLLTGDASKQYAFLFDQLKTKAPGQQLTLTAKVVDVGVAQLQGNTAQLLVFLDQSSTRASNNQTSASAAQIEITAVRQGTSWKISELVTL